MQRLQVKYYRNFRDKPEHRKSMSRGILIAVESKDGWGTVIHKASGKIENIPLKHITVTEKFNEEK